MSACVRGSEICGTAGSGIELESGGVAVYKERTEEEVASCFRYRLRMLAAVRCSGARRRTIAVALRQVCCPSHQHIVPSFHRGLAYCILIVLLISHDDTSLRPTKC